MLTYYFNNWKATYSGDIFKAAQRACSCLEVACDRLVRNPSAKIKVFWSSGGSSIHLQALEFSGPKLVYTSRAFSFGPCTFGPCTLARQGGLGSLAPQAGGLGVPSASPGKQGGLGGRRPPNCHESDDLTLVKPFEKM